MKPTFHEEFEIGDRVSCRLSPKLTGEICGISSTGIIFHYIILLDTPYSQPPFNEKPWKAVSISGTELSKLP